MWLLAISLAIVFIVLWSINKNRDTNQEVPDDFFPKFDISKDISYNIKCDDNNDCIYTTDSGKKIEFNCGDELCKKTDENQQKFCNLSNILQGCYEDYHDKEITTDAPLNNLNRSDFTFLSDEYDTNMKDAVDKPNCINIKKGTNTIFPKDYSVKYSSKYCAENDDCLSFSVSGDNNSNVLDYNSNSICFYSKPAKRIAAWSVKNKPSNLSYVKRIFQDDIKETMQNANILE